MTTQSLLLSTILYKDKPCFSNSLCTHLHRSGSSVNDSEQAFMARLVKLDLEPIIYRVMNNPTTQWSLEFADRIAFSYRAFLLLVEKYPNKAIVPSVAVDEFWHQHILDTEKYQEDCQILFGHFLHHFPYYGMRGEADKQALDSSFNETLALFAEQFGELSTFGFSTASTCLFGEEASAKSSSCLFGEEASIKSSSCLFGEEASIKSSSCLFGEEASAKSSSCLFGEEASAKSSNCLFDDKAKIDWTRPRPVRSAC